MITSLNGYFLYTRSKSSHSSDYLYQFWFNWKLTLIICKHLIKIDLTLPGLSKNPEPFPFATTVLDGQPRFKLISSYPSPSLSGCYQKSICERVSVSGHQMNSSVMLGSTSSLSLVFHHSMLIGCNKGWKIFINISKAASYALRYTYPTKLPSVQNIISYCISS